MKPLLLIILASSAFALPSSDFDSRAFSKVVVISDVHGDDKAFLKSLWIAYSRVQSQNIEYAEFEALFKEPYPQEPIHKDSNVLLVQMGDLIDRGRFGSRSVQILSLVPRVLGWGMRVLYGNHDMFTLLGFPYLGMIHINEDINREYGHIKREGPLWKWLVSNQLLALRIKNAANQDGNDGSSLFLHAGANLEWLDNFLYDYGQGVEFDITGLNLKMQLTIARGESGGTLKTFEDPGSVVMSRHLLSLPRDDVCDDLNEVLEMFGVSRLFVGHTPMPTKRVMSRCDGRLILTDVGMSRWMYLENENLDDPTGGQPSAIVMSFASGSLETLKAYYTGSVEESTIFEESIMDIDGQNEEAAPSGPSLKRSRSATLEQGNLIYQDYHMEIFKDEMDGNPGFLVKFQHSNEITKIKREINSLLEKLGETPFGIPRIQWIAETSQSDSSSLHVDEGQQRMFIETSGPDSALVVKLEQKLIMPIRKIAQTIHQAGKCIGINEAFMQLPTQEPFSSVITRFFSVEADEMVYLINYTFLHDCDADAQRNELDIITNAHSTDSGSIS